jgi:hypothetical protein
LKDAIAAHQRQCEELDQEDRGDDDIENSTKEERDIMMDLNRRWRQAKSVPSVAESVLVDFD